MSRPIRPNPQERSNGILPDFIIRHLAQDHGMISPFEEGTKREGKISYGLTHYGYDFRLGYENYLFAEWGANKLIDPKQMVPKEDGEYVEVDSDCILVPPHSMLLGQTIEEWNIPEDVVAEARGKSTYARCGLIVNTTPFEPGWRGKATICILNPTVSSIRVYPGEGIGQMMFHVGLAAPEQGYHQKSGKYQDSQGVTGSTVD
jgi:dCTP deaminase